MGTSQVDYDQGRVSPSQWNPGPDRREPIEANATNAQRTQMNWAESACADEQRTGAQMASVLLSSSGGWTRLSPSART